MDLHHETIAFDRTFPVPPARLFQAFADPREREIWSAPTEDIEIRIDESDFRSGGTEKGYCGPKGNLHWTMDVAYHLVVANRLITFTEVLRDSEKILTVALITFDITEGDGGTRLRLTDQVTSFVGVGGSAGHNDGYTKALENLKSLFVPA